MLALVAAMVAVGYTAWETRNLRTDLDRIAVGNETRITEMMLSLLHSEGQLARIRETVELLGGSDGSDTAARDEGALAGKITATLTAAQREVLQQELSKWTRQLHDQQEKGWEALREGLEQKLNGNAADAEERDKRWQELKTLVQQNQQSLAIRLEELGSGLSGLPDPSGAIEEQGATLMNLEERLGTVLEATQKGRQALTRQGQRDDRRWQELLLVLQENMEATQQRYAELAARLDRRRGATQQPARPAPPETQGQGSRGSQDQGLDRERLAEFCAEVPQAAICRER